MRWLRTRVREFLGIHVIRDDTQTLLGRVQQQSEAIVEQSALLVKMTEAQHEQSLRITFLASFFGEIPDDGEPLTKRDMSNKLPWDKT